MVRYESRASVNCSTTVTHTGMGWEASQGAVDMKHNVQHITWTVENVTHWDLKPICYINVHKQIEEELNITIYSEFFKYHISVCFL